MAMLVTLLVCGYGHHQPVVTHEEQDKVVFGLIGLTSPVVDSQDATAERHATLLLPCHSYFHT